MRNLIIVSGVGILLMVAAAACKKRSEVSPVAPVLAPPAPTTTFTFTSILTPTPTMTGQCGAAFGTCTFTETATDSPTNTATPAPTDTNTSTRTPTSTHTNLGGYTSTPTSTLTGTPVPAGFIDNLEDGDNQVIVREGRDGYWFNFTDSMGTVIWPALGSFTSSPGGMPTSPGYAARITGIMAASCVVPDDCPFACMGCNFKIPTAAYDASGYTGLTFWARLGAGSSTNVRVSFPVPGTESPIYDGGTCAGTCGDHFGRDLVLSGAWTQYTVFFADLTQNGWGTPAVFSESLILKAMWNIVDIGTAFDLWVDDVRFTTQPAPTHTPVVSVTPTASPTHTPTPILTPTPYLPPTPMASPPTGYIVWSHAMVYRFEGAFLYLEGTTTPTPIATTVSAAILYLRVNGAPEAVATVRVIGSDGSDRTLAYSGPTTYEGVFYAAYSNCDLYGGDFQYVPGVTYTLVSHTSVGTAYGSLQAPGGITHLPDGSRSSWSVEGTQDTVRVEDENQQTLFWATPDTSSPVDVPLSAYSACGEDRLITQCANTLGAVTGATLADTMFVMDRREMAVTVFANCTAVPTATPSSTPTLTPTPYATAPPGAVVWYDAQIYRRRNNGNPYAPAPTPNVETGASLSLQVNGLPESTASVWITSSGGIQNSLPYMGWAISGGVTYAYYKVDANPGFYLPGSVYTFTTLTSVGLAYGSVLAPGDVTHAPDGTFSTWNVEGDGDMVAVMDILLNWNFFTGFGDIISPVGIPPSAYSACGMNWLVTLCNNTGSVTGATLGGTFSANDTLWTPVTVTAACTVLPTPTQTP